MAEGVPLPTITWEKDGIPLTDTTGEYTILPTGELLIDAAQVGLFLVKLFIYCDTFLTHLSVCVARGLWELHVRWHQLRRAGQSYRRPISPHTSSLYRAPGRCGTQQGRAPPTDLWSPWHPYTKDHMGIQQQYHPRYFYICIY